MAKGLNSIDALVDAGLLELGQSRALNKVAKRYAVSVSPELALLIDRNDRADPIARQFLPTLRELDVSADELIDPIGDARHSPVRGIVHRHPDRVLLRAVASCPVYCRFCFRRETIGPASAEALSARELESALDCI